jgi:hypothetical protein
VAVAVSDGVLLDAAADLVHGLGQVRLEKVTGSIGLDE